MRAGRSQTGEACEQGGPGPKEEADTRSGGPRRQERAQSVSRVRAAPAKVGARGEMDAQGKVREREYPGEGQLELA